MLAGVLDAVLMNDMGTIARFPQPSSFVGRSTRAVVKVGNVGLLELGEV